MLRLRLELEKELADARKLEAEQSEKEPEIYYVTKDWVQYNFNKSAELVAMSLHNASYAENGWDRATEKGERKEWFKLHGSVPLTPYE